MKVENIEELKRAVEADLVTMLSDISDKVESEIRDRAGHLEASTGANKIGDKLVVNLKITKKAGETDDAFQQRKMSLNEIGARSYVVVRKVVAQGYK